MTHKLKLLFLDFDGVLHPAHPRRELPKAENRRFSYLPRFEALMSEYSEWYIIISSSWRSDHSEEDLRNLFRSNISRRIVGTTPVLRCKEPPYPQYPRYQEIQMYLATLETPLEKIQWIALDDDPSLFPPDCPELVLCQDGFRENEEARLREAMGEAIDAKTLVYSEQVEDLGDGRTCIEQVVHSEVLWEDKRRRREAFEEGIRSGRIKPEDCNVFTPEVLKNFKLTFPLLDEAGLDEWLNEPAPENKKAPQ